MSLNDFSSLIKTINGYKRAFEHDDYDIDRIISTLKEEEIKEENNGPEEGKTSESRREKHPLDYVKRWGWKHSDFHALLSKWGFDTDEVNGNGHYFIKLRKTGEKLRHPSGRFMIVGGSNLEVTPGMAHQVLKACARYLIENEKRLN